MDDNWPILLFRKSVLKQRKFKEVTSLLGDTRRLHCLDIGSDNGVVSYLLRKRGGSWKSADLDPKAVDSIRNLVSSDVFHIGDRFTPFLNNEFDRVVIVDFLEHIHPDREFIGELFRIMAPGSELVINVPHFKNSLLRKVRSALGQTDEKHGHVRPGYTIDSLQRLLRDKFTIISYRTYSKFFSECIDMLISLGFQFLKKEDVPSPKGLLVTGDDLSRHRTSLRVYSLIYPLVWCLARLDTLLFWCSGYRLIARARICDKQRCLQAAASLQGSTK